MAFSFEEWSLIIGHFINLGTVILGVIGARMALSQYRSANQTRREDLRWRQAEHAENLLNQIMSNPNVVNAFRLLDWNGAKKFLYTNGDESGHIEATWADQDTDLQQSSGSLREMFVRESFDSLYEAFERVEHAITIGAVIFEDVEQPFRYYVSKIYLRKKAFDTFQMKWGYKRAGKFIERYSRILAKPTAP